MELEYHRGNSLIIALIVGLLFTLSSHATAQATFQNYIPYRSFEDSPFKDLTYRYFYLEDFEDGNLNTPGVVTIQRSVVIGQLGYRSRFVDSV
jgi:hypothetical protein